MSIGGLEDLLTGAGVVAAISYFSFHFEKAIRRDREINMIISSDEFEAMIESDYSYKAVKRLWNYACKKSPGRAILEKRAFGLSRLRLKDSYWKQFEELHRKAWEKYNDPKGRLLFLLENEGIQMYIKNDSRLYKKDSLAKKAYLKIKDWLNSALNKLLFPYYHL